MPRRNQHRRRTSASNRREPTFGGATARIENGPATDADEAYLVRPVPGARAVKVYRCPGCDHEIAVGVPHVVVWPHETPGGAEDRRHWHTGCWSGRRSRGPTRTWS